jgi:arylsulfatase A
MRWPGQLEGGREVADIVHFADWFPTLLNLCESDIPDRIDHDGVDVMPVLKGRSAVDYPNRCWQWSSYEPLPDCNAAIRDGDWKLLWPDRYNHRPLKDYELVDLVRFMNADDLESSGVPLPQSGEYETLDSYFAYLKRESAKPLPEGAFTARNPPELYNIGNDPHETGNVADENPEVVRRLQTELDDWFERNRPDWERCRADDPYGMR